MKACERIHYFATAMVLGLAVSASAQTPVVGPITNSNNGHVYYVVPRQTWSGAEAEALALGGNLVTIRSASENNWIITHLLVDFSGSGGPNLSNVPLWIGLFDPNINDGSNHAADFEWVDGETNSYRNWNSGEPSNSGNVEYFGCINWHHASNNQTIGTWNDAGTNGTLGLSTNCSGPYYGIAEVFPVSTNVVCGPFINWANGHVYYVLPPGTWTQAQTEARALGGDLATIRSAAENGWIVTNILVNFTSAGGPDLSHVSIWIGLFDPVMLDGTGTGHASDFLWVDGETNSYRDWNASEPNNIASGEYFTALNWPFAGGQGSAGTWNDTGLKGTSFAGTSSGPGMGPYYGLAELSTGVLGIQLQGTNAVLSVPYSRSSLVLETASHVYPAGDWTPVSTNFGQTNLTFPVSPGGRAFFRLVK